MPNPATPLSLNDRLALMMRRDMTRLALSQDGFLGRIKEINPHAKSPRTIARYATGSAETEPTPQTLGLIAQALDWSDEVRNWVLEGDAPGLPGRPQLGDRVVAWDDLVDYLNQQSNLPYKINKLREEARAATLAGESEVARVALGAVADALRHLAAPLVEDLSRALAAQGNHAFSEGNYVDAREHYGEAIRLHPVPEDRLSRYRRSYLIASNACMSFARTSDEARAIMAEMRAQKPPVLPDVVTWNTLAALARSEPEVRAIMAEMRAQDPPVLPNVVTWSTLLAKSPCFRRARVILRAMRRFKVVPDDISIFSAVAICERFEEAFEIIEFAFREGWQVGGSSMTALFSRPITHLTAKDVLAAYFALPFQWDVSLGNVIRQFRRDQRHRDAVIVCLAAPHIPPAQKYYKERYRVCEPEFRALRAEGNDEDNLYYAYGIAAALNKDAAVAREMLGVARQRATHPNRVVHIDRLLGGL